MRIVIRHDDAGRWWWAALRETGGTAAVSAAYTSRADCLRAVAELKVEGPAASVTVEDGGATGPGARLSPGPLPAGT